MQLMGNRKEPGYDFDPENLRHWCFDDCPEAELIACWHYEYLRDCPSVIRKVLKWRNTAAPRQGTPEENLIDFFWGDPYERIITEWPRLPYLEIKPRIRRAHLAMQNAQGQITANWIRNNPLKQNAVAFFPITDWGDSDTELLAKFKHWLKDVRPKDIKIRETRGRSKTRTHLRSALRALGACRLARVMSQNKVIRFAFEHGKPLYSNQPELSKALKRTTRYLGWLDETAG